MSDGITDMHTGTCYVRMAELIEKAGAEDLIPYTSLNITKTQLEDGSWEIPWQWDDYPDEWAISRNWWKCHVIISNLLYLKGFA